jgi:hypothetical protein
MKLLVYWYGVKESNSFYGFVAQSTFTPYHEEAAKGLKGVAKLPARIQRKISEGAAVKGKDQEVLRAYQELEEDLQKEPGERKRGVVAFREGYDLLCEEDVDAVLKMEAIRHRKQIPAHATAERSQSVNCATDSSSTGHQQWKRQRISVPSTSTTQSPTPTWVTDPVTLEAPKEETRRISLAF